MEKVMQVEKIDNYSEQIVKRKMTSSKFSALVLSIAGIVVLIALSIYLSGYFNWLVPVALLFLGLGIYLSVMLIKNSGIEYEYTCVIGEMRIDKIKGKSKRKKITVFDVKAIDDIGKYIDTKTGNRSFRIGSLFLYAAPRCALRRRARAPRSPCSGRCTPPPAHPGGPRLSRPPGRR